MHKSLTLEVIGDQRLACDGCERRVERLLRGLPGVGRVRAQAQNQRIDVLFDTAVLKPAAITERLGAAGYQTRVSDSPSDSGGG